MIIGLDVGMLARRCEANISEAVEEENADEQGCPTPACQRFVLSCATAPALKSSPDQTPSLPGDEQPLGGGKPVTTTTIKRCPDGRELVVRLNDALGCAKDIVPPNG